MKGRKNRVISLTTGAERGKLQEGTFRFSFNGESISLGANAHGLSAWALKARLSQLQNIDRVSVTRSKVNDYDGATYDITFLSWPAIPHENNLYSHAGNPSLDSFSCDAINVSGKGLSGPKCIISDVVNSNIIEYLPCSNRGECDETAGKCKCQPGWSGIACDDNSDDGDVRAFVANGPHFTGTLLKLKTSRESENSFSFIKATSGNESSQVFALKGDGSILMNNGNLDISHGSASISGGSGLQVETSEGDFSAISAASQGSVVNLHAKGRDFSSSILSITAETDPSSNFKLIDFPAPTGEPVFEVDGNGQMTARGGVVISQDNPEAEINSPKATIGAGGLRLTDGVGLTIEDGADINVGMGEVRVTSSTTALTLSRHSTDISQESDAEQATLILQQQNTSPHLEIISNTNVTVFKIEGSGETKIHGGMSTFGGIAVKSGGLTVESGGLVVDGGLRLKSGQLQLDSDQGLHVTGKEGIKVMVDSDAGHSFVGRSTSQTFRSSLMKLEGPVSQQDNQYNFLEMSSIDDKNVCSVSSSGVVFTNGGIVSEGDVFINRQLLLNGGFAMKRTSTKAADFITISDVGSLSFLEIFDDGSKSENWIKFNGTPSDGQLVVVKNSDTESLSGAMKVPPDSTLIYVFIEPHGWSDVTTLHSHKHQLKGVTLFQAANDLDIGNHALSTQHLFLKSKSDLEHNGQLAFYGPGGQLIGDEAISFDLHKQVLNIDTLSAKTFVGDSMNFLGATISNAALVNATLDGIQHLTVGSLGIQSESYENRKGYRMAVFDEHGGLSSAEFLRVDNKKRGLKVESLTSFSSVLHILSDMDINGHTLRNVNVEANTTLRDIFFDHGIITNTVLRNVTATDLKLGSVVMEELTLSSLAITSGAFLTISSDGKVTMSDSIRTINDVLEVNTAVQFLGSMDMKSNEISNVHISSGRIDGDGIDVRARSIAAESITIIPVQNSKSAIGDSVLLVDKHGTLKRGGISVIDGTVSDMRITGTLNFENTAQGQGRITNAFIEGGSISGVQTLHVDGEAKIGGGVNINGEAFIDGGLTVSGSVLGSGPYIDMSDVRLKKSIEKIPEGSALKGITKLQGVTYELHLPGNKWDSGQKRHVGFIAQDVEEIYPELVETRDDGYKGVSYARFVPILTEGLKEMRLELQQLKTSYKELQAEHESLKETIQSLFNSYNER